jgi:PKD repeat protein
MLRRSLQSLAVLTLATFMVSCDGGGDSPMEPKDPLTPNEAPTASFTTSVEEGTAPLSVAFDAASSFDPDGMIASYSWDFGDGGTGTGQQAVHTFTDAGLFRVVLTVRDDRSGEDAASDSVFAVTPPGSGANTIRGSVWYDRNADGTRDGEEPGLHRFVVFIDLDTNGERDTGEPLTFSGVDGSYRFDGLDAATTYTVTQALTFGWTNTTPGTTPLLPADTGPAPVINGEETQAGLFPFQVALMVGSFQFCGGTLVNSRYVLTAAHCVVGADPTDFEVLIGTEDLASGGERVTVVSIREHPEFSNTLDYDVALLRLGTPQLYPRPFLQTPDQPSLSIPGTTATTIGWGETEGGSDTNHKACSDAAGIFFGVIGDRTVCAGGTNLDRGVCFGDSGGPLLVPYQGSWAQVGITSFLAARDNCGDVPSAFSRVSELYSYIEGIGRIEASGSYVIDWSTGPDAQVDFGNFH